MNWYEGGKLIRSLNYKDLWNEIQSHAIQIEKFAKSGDCVVLLFEMGLSFMVHFFACLRVGVIAVPCYPPVPGNEQKGIEILTKVLENSGAKIVLMSPNIENMKKMKGKWPVDVNSESLTYTTLTIKTNKSSKSTLAGPTRPLPERKDAAFIQYTSGSTGDPKGVCIGHDSLQNNVAHSVYWIANTVRGPPLPLHQAVVTSWLPMYHDMGLTLVSCSGLFCGGIVNLMSPFDFLRDPLVWFDIISATATTHAVAPNFAYGLITRKWDTQRAKKWNMSTLHALANSAEPIVRTTVDNFLAVMKRDVPSFRPLCFSPGYGMAETVAYIGSSVFMDPLIFSRTNPSHIASIPYCEQRIDEIRVVDVNNDNTICPPEVEGEIWISICCNARGYWNQPELTKEVFENKLEGEGDRLWLRTGDLGYIENGHLFVSGRLKDVIIINGRNYWPQDIEVAVQHAHDAIRQGCVIAFGVETADTQEVCVVCEIRDDFIVKFPSHSFLNDVIAAIEQVVRVIVARDCKHVVLIKEHTIPKTTSGKVRRREAKRRWKEHELQEILRYSPGGTENAIDYVEALQWVAPLVQEHAESFTYPTAMEEQCRSLLIRFGVYKQHDTLSMQGVDSLKAASIGNEIEIRNPSMQKQIAVQSLFEWTGEELALALMGKLPGRDQEMVYGTPLPNRIDPPLNKEKLIKSFSLPLRIVCETIGMSMFFLTILGSILPCIYFYQRMKYLDTPLGMWEVEEVNYYKPGPYWVSYGVVLILFAPIFFVAFTLLWMIQRWIIWGYTRSGFIPMNSLQYYRWWYIDTLTSIWETLCFSFISGTPLVNIIYWCIGGTQIPFSCTIYTPLRYPEIVKAGAWCNISGSFLMYDVLCHGVSMAPITMGHQCSFAWTCVVNRGTVFDDKTSVAEICAVPPFTHLEGGYNWKGNACYRDSSNDPSIPDLFDWILERLWRICIVFSLIWGSVLGVALSQRLWYEVFPQQPTTKRIGDFWLNVWTYYGTGFTWCAIVLAIKWIVFGKAKPGVYKPGFREDQLRWALGYYAGFVGRLVWSHIELSSCHIWYRLLGASIASSATVVFISAHPADMDLVEIHEHARISFSPINVMNYDKNRRDKVIIGEGAEVGIYGTLGPGVILKENAKVNAGVVVEADRTIPADHIVRTSYGKAVVNTSTRQVDVEPLLIPVGILSFIGNLAADGTAVMAGWLSIWFAYFVYRSIHHALQSTWLSLFLTMWITIITNIFTFPLMLRIWYKLIYMNCQDSNNKMIGYIIWRWIHMFRCVSHGPFYYFWNSTYLFNLSMKLAGSKVSPSARQFNNYIRDLGHYVLDDFAVVNDGAVYLGHAMVNHELRFGYTTVEAYASVQSKSILFAGANVPTMTESKAWQVVTTKINGLTEHAQPSGSTLKRIPSMQPSDLSVKIIMSTAAVDDDNYDEQLEHYYPV